MGPASTVQREPSMEEILASIRRIIEDSDGARPMQPETIAEAAEERKDGAVIEVDAFRAELRGKDAPSVPAVEPDVVVRPSAVATPAPATSEPSAESSAQGDLDAGFDQAFGTIREATEAAERPASSPTPHASPAGVGSTVESGRPAIISERTGRQVAAAFGELSEAFAASRRRSFDEIAEEMMRPMLQDWLDNNLPTLVERLVREEIERIARGG